ncbi:ABC-2 transporter permease [Hominifimenecus sp. rT4P-3]|uniref:ABC-2 transporter permease n=1 Tax=Hominifimenecus sp. rT4P-3 TaxID=3242979 RepID=UPI003DA393F8
MIGLLLKDFYSLTKSLKIFVVVFLIYGVMSFTNGEGALLTFVIVLIAMMIPVTVLGLDEKDQWDVFALTMPVNATMMVAEKFLLMLVCCVIGIGGGTAVTILFATAGGQIDMGAIMETAIPSIAIVVVYNSVLFPIVYRFGADRGRIVSMVVIMVPAVLFMMLEKQGMFPDLSVFFAWFTATGWKLCVVIFPAMLIVSFLLSLHIYQKKEW